MKKKKDDFKAFELSNWKDGVAIKREGKEKKKKRGEGGEWSSLRENE